MLELFIFIDNLLLSRRTSRIMHKYAHFTYYAWYMMHYALLIHSIMGIKTSLSTSVVDLWRYIIQAIKVQKIEQFYLCTSFCKLFVSSARCQNLPRFFVMAIEVPHNGDPFVAYPILKKVAKWLTLLYSAMANDLYIGVYFWRFLVKLGVEMRFKDFLLFSNQ